MAPLCDVVRASVVSLVLQPRTAAQACGFVLTPCYANWCEKNASHNFARKKKKLTAEDRGNLCEMLRNTTMRLESAQVNQHDGAFILNALLVFDVLCSA
uniref:Putative secreted protein n=1 Tax=Ixodes ricinus TaxID=34613 RepID=A0A6B0UEC6_IXORI